MDQNSIQGPPWLSSRDVEFEGNILFPMSMFLTHRAPGSCHRRPERQSAITYDYSEEELMASIEQEYTAAKAGAAAAPWSASGQCAVPPSPSPSRLGLLGT